MQNHDVFIANNDYQAKKNRTDESKKNDTPDLPNRLDATDTYDRPDRPADRTDLTYLTHYTDKNDQTAQDLMNQKNEKKTERTPPSAFCLHDEHKGLTPVRYSCQHIECISINSVCNINHAVSPKSNVFQISAERTLPSTFCLHHQKIGLNKVHFYTDFNRTDSSQFVRFAQSTKQSQTKPFF